MKVHQIFPIVIGQDLFESHEEFKSNNFEELKLIRERQRDNSLPDLYFLHLNVKYLEFFKSLKNSIENYLILLGVNPDVVNLHVVRSWVESYDTNTGWTNHHNNRSSDLSFRYYLKTSKDKPDVVCFESENYQNELFEGIFNFSNDGGMFKNINKYNCVGYAIPPTEGSLLMFPSPLKVDMELNQDTTETSYVIAGDIKITLKPKHYQISQSIPHTSQWLDLERY
jgi:hypothetical protein